MKLFDSEASVTRHTLDIFPKRIVLSPDVTRVYIGLDVDCVFEGAPGLVVERRADIGPLEWYMVTKSPETLGEAEIPAEKPEVVE